MPLEFAGPATPLSDHDIEAASRRTLKLLTSREDQIAALVTDGLSNKEIAQALRISPATVKNHVHSILEKLELSRRSAIGTSLGVQQTSGESGRNWCPAVRQAAST